MNIKSLSKRQWVLISVSVVIVAGAVWAMQAGYLPEIGKFFAAEPGYVPSCAWYGEPVSSVQQCCSGLVPLTPEPLRPVPSYILNASATPGGSDEYIKPSPTLIGRPVPTSTSTITPPSFTKIPTPAPSLPYTKTPSPVPPAYCVMPGCKIVQRQVYCIQAPCPAQIDIVCPSGITPPPRPSVTPTPSTPITIVNPNDGAPIIPGSRVGIDWTINPAVSAPDKVDIILLDERAYNYVIALDADNNGDYVWNTSLPLQRLNAEGTVMLSDVSGDKLIIQIAGRGPFSTVWGRTRVTLVRGTSTPTVTPTPPPFQGVSVGFGSPILQTAQVPLSTKAHGIGLQMRPNPQTPKIGGAAMTAVSMRVTYNPQFLKPHSVTSQYFPDVLQPITIKNVSPTESYFTFAVGSGTSPAQVSFATSPLALAFTPLKVGNAGAVQVNDVVITMPGRADNASRVDANNFPNILVEIFDDTPSVPGDANGDGKVDIFDYNLVVSNFGKTGTNIPGDVNKDGKVDIFDYNLVISNFGK